MGRNIVLRRDVYESGFHVTQMEFSDLGKTFYP